eukprot:CAMPEP_0118708334 /NCGR_PEP_ID=MMETSP0800-20121206/21812_1 /TAXON_ID=210618 ORGANISM="Striatella unipunctata, Strain CCMP2910" /NCGR_SAMPLE_ID=MMETSP0800 /ASSEMBLY_ACC=CAM_ASM_000638 /LENGTH=116 /DNA_ID=CAMNT_0006611481 /DNA_START=401 /DNA_END=748 /DNA_ORIENTATION=-
MERNIVAATTINPPDSERPFQPTQTLQSAAFFNPSTTNKERNINVSQGLAGETLTDVLQYVKQELLDGKQKMTAGNLFKSNKVILDLEIRYGTKDTSSVQEAQGRRCCAHNQAASL